MKTNAPKLHAAAALLAGIIFAHTAITAKAQIIDPASGQPAPDHPNPIHLNPTNGMPVLMPGQPDPNTAPLAAAITDQQVRELIDDGQYEEALQQCLSFQRALTGNHTMIPLVPDWVELCRRFPKAREALIEVRDNYNREFSEGRGYAHLFSEVSAINSDLGQDDATYALFQRIGQQDKKLAQQCFGCIVPLLIQRGEFDLCLSYIGDPQAQFASSREAFVRQLDSVKRMAEMHQRTAQRIAQINQKLGIPNSMLPPDFDAAAMVKKFAENGFVEETRQLIEILVGAGRKPEAEKIRDEAVLVLDDPRLQSAVADAEQKIKK
jgi:hypothetical protein